ncbi:hypothetical protein ACZ11_19630 [Lysinibacillus xylanilyticus]|uniref:Uncharacterized protein n=1 Tax=Lysinibacillus xylanilyticus TaxID=582475 RepID=A0A0K9F447_9BACI|nr:hypothetical protein ACZ11_19630 [Lysinibacillus xylanilyticus]
MAGKLSDERLGAVTRPLKQDRILSPSTLLSPALSMTIMIQGGRSRIRSTIDEKDGSYNKNHLVLAFHKKSCLKLIETTLINKTNLL